MKINKLASAILRGSWLLDSRAADLMYPIAERFLAGERVAWFDDEKSEDKSFLAAYVFTLEGARQNLKAQQDASQPANIFSGADPGSIAVIPIEGHLMPEDNCGSPGTETLSAWLMDAYMSPNIIGAVLKSNSPGGTVEGTDEFASVVAYVASQMPVESFVTGQACSACLWAISPTRITASSGTVEIGSIGTAANFNDYSQGSNVKKHYITADKSFDKNKDAIEALKGNYQPIKDNIINPTNEIFHAAIITNRGDKLQLADVTNDAGDVIGQTPMTGQVYLAQPAIDNGLIDAIGNFESVTNSIRSRAASDEFKTTAKHSDMSLFNSKFKKLNALKGKKAAEITDADIVAVNEELEAEGFEEIAIISLAHFNEAQTNADAVTEGLTAINAALGLDATKSHKTIAEAITALVADRDSEYDRAEAYGDQPGAKPTNPKTKKESEGTATTQTEMTSWERKMARKIAQTTKNEE